MSEEEVRQIRKEMEGGDLGGCMAVILTVMLVVVMGLMAVEIVELKTRVDALEKVKMELGR